MNAQVWPKSLWDLGRPTKTQKIRMAHIEVVIIFLYYQNFFLVNHATMKFVCSLNVAAIRRLELEKVFISSKDGIWSNFSTLLVMWALALCPTTLTLMFDYRLLSPCIYFYVFESILCISQRLLCWSFGSSHWKWSW